MSSLCCLWLVMLSTETGLNLINANHLRESVCNCCLTLIEQLYGYIIARASHIRWDDVCFVLDQHIYLILLNNMPLHSDILSRLGAIQSFVLFANTTCLKENAANSKYYCSWFDTTVIRTDDIYVLQLRHSSHYNT